MKFHSTHPPQLYWTLTGAVFQVFCLQQPERNSVGLRGGFKVNKPQSVLNEGILEAIWSGKVFLIYFFKQMISLMLKRLLILSNQ